MLQNITNSASPLESAAKEMAGVAHFRLGGWRSTISLRARPRLFADDFCTCGLIGQVLICKFKVEHS